MLKIQNLSVHIDQKEILRNINLEIPKGQIQVLLGRNGSGKSTLAQTIMGLNQAYEGEILLDGEIITHQPPEIRSRKGLFVSFQNPPAIKGVGLANLIKEIVWAKDKACDREPTPTRALLDRLKKLLAEFGFMEEFLTRDVNLDWSGGEKKKAELIQMLMLEPSLVVLDEIDSGLDINSIELVASILKKYAVQAGILVITHNLDFVERLPVERIFVLQSNTISLSGGKEIIQQLRLQGFESV